MENGGAPCTANKGAVPLIATSPRYPDAPPTSVGSSTRRGEVLLIRDLDREDGAGRGCFEDRGDAGRRAGDEQDVAVRQPQPIPPRALQERTEGRADVDRGPFEAHGTAGTERRDRADDAIHEVAETQRPAVVERPDVFVGGRG